MKAERKLTPAVNQTVCLEEHLYTVGELCERCGVTRKTLFYYDRTGLLKPTRRVGPQSYKVYDCAAAERLSRILEYREAGLSIQEIRTLLDPQCTDRKSVLENALIRLERDMNQRMEQVGKLKDLIQKEGI